ncbi:MAG: UDP-3-O-(3-hydroxymyristoyl)glucosamine N-acyltransferase [Acidobacteria bacterium]|nr:UDP-3-O-(3-hydroxymyristoyl)glucosamine N-acyltransferase [Acidobacteriota bacterium]MCA1608665.1 UDP-3-O-(3-hydroxymyristoyl)glucosamine N-acyltransferase [Acidobacteriota bacterium]
MKTREIADFLNGDLAGNAEVEIKRVAEVGRAGENEIAFLEDPAKYRGTSAAALLAPASFIGPVESAVIHVDNPKLAFALLAQELYPAKRREAFLHPTAVVYDTATIGENCFIGAFVCVGDESSVGDSTQLRAGAKIGDGVRIGRRCVIHPNVFVEDGCTIGDEVILHSGVVIGADGFGYVRDKDRYVKFPQIDTVLIENEVEIGANSCVDRGALGETRIGAGTKIDNLVQVGHNVQIGKRCIIAAQTGISGSTIIEDDCVIGGQVGFGDHARVQSGAIIGSQAGVLPGKIVRPGVWWGTPVMPLDEYKRHNAHLKSIKRMKNEISDLKRRLDEIKK